MFKAAHAHGSVLRPVSCHHDHALPLGRGHALPNGEVLWEVRYVWHKLTQSGMSIPLEHWAEGLFDRVHSDAVCGVLYDDSADFVKVCDKKFHKGLSTRAT